MVVLFEEQIKKACMQRSQGNGEESEEHGPFQKEMIFSEREREREREMSAKRGGLVLRNPMILFEGTGGRD